MAEEEEEEATSADIHALFCHYNALYFGDALGACVVSWSSSPPLDSCTGTCDYHPDGGCEIRISEPLLKFCPTSDLKNALLHEMIHACLFIKNKDTNHSDHGSNFKGILDAINSSLVKDYEKPPDGYNITISHGFKNGVHQSSCGSCGDLRSGCNEPCGNSSCCAHSHKLLLDGDRNAAELTGSKDKELIPKDGKELPKDRYKGLQYRRTARKSCRLLDNQKSTTRTDPFPSEDAADINQGSIPSSHDPKQKKKITAIKNKSHAIKTDMPKAVRTVYKPKTQKYSGKKRGKRSTCKYEYNVIIKLLDVYTDEEVEEDLEPLINKRTERRKKQKLLKDRVYPSHTRVDNNDHKSPSNSPAMDDIIDISDG